MARKRSPAPVRPDPSRTRLRLVLAALVAVAFLNGLPNGFTFDDLTIVRDDPRLESPSRIGEVLTTGYWGRAGDVYRPVVRLSFAVGRWVHGPSAPWFRVVNVLLHALVTCLLLEWFLALGFRFATCAWAAALFAVLPVHVEAVTSLVGRAELLAAAFSLASALAWMRATRDGGLRLAWGAVAAASFALALLSKESAAVLPAILVLAELFRSDGGELPARARWRRVTALAVFGGATLLAVLGLRALVLGGANLSLTTPPNDLANALGSLPAGLRFLNAANLLWLYVAKSLVPVGLSADYSAWAIRPIREFSDPRLWIGAFAWIAAATAAFLRRRSEPDAAFGTLLFPITFLPASNLFLSIGTIFGERLAYLPSAGISLVAATLLVRAGDAALRRVPGRPRIALLPAAAVVALLPFTVARNRDWKDDRTLYESIVRTQPGSAGGHYLAAFDAYRRDDLARAEAGARRSVAIYPAHPSAWSLLGEVLWRQGRYAEAIEAQTKTVELFPQSADALFYLALWKARTGHTDEARALLRRGLERFPGEKAFANGLRELDGLTAGDGSGPR